MGGWQLNDLLSWSLSTFLTRASGSLTSLFPPLFPLWILDLWGPLPSCLPLCVCLLPPPLSPTLPPSSRFSGTTTLTRAHLNSKEDQQDTDPRRTAHSPLETSKVKCQTPVSPQASLNQEGSPQGQAYPAGIRSPGSAVSKDAPGMDSRPGSMKKGDNRASPRESGATIQEGAQPSQGLKEGPNSGAKGQKSSVIPDNIRHKFGSDVVDQLVTEEQVSAQGPGAPGGRRVVRGDV